MSADDRKVPPMPRLPQRAPIVLASLLTVPLLFAAPALAGDGHEAEAGQAESHCPAPEVDHHYNPENLSVHVKLPASGCASREHSIFMVSAQLTRTDFLGPQESVWRSVRCGPFRSAADQEPGDAASEYFCDLDVALEHQPVETSDYEIEVTFPGASAERTLTLDLACTSDGKAATCDTSTA
jgi:hypothetical protein